MNRMIGRVTKGIFQTSVEFLFPPVCPCCDRGLTSDTEGACQSCRQSLGQLSLNKGKRCGRCFSLMNGVECEYCRSRPVFFDGHRALLPMQGMWREVLHRWKYENDRRLWQIFWSICMDSNCIEELRGRGIERIAWIDSGSAGRQLRNFQPCADMARALATALNVPCGPHLKKKKRKGQKIQGNQSSQAYVDRFFAIHDSLEYCGPMGSGNWLLIEDVFTTGATANEAARVLKKNGAFHVFVLSLLLRDAYTC